MTGDSNICSFGSPFLFPVNKMHLPLPIQHLILEKNPRDNFNKDRMDWISEILSTKPKQKNKSSPICSFLPRWTTTQISQLHKTNLEPIRTEVTARQRENWVLWSTCNIHHAHTISTNKRYYCSISPFTTTLYSLIVVNVVFVIKVTAWKPLLMCF